MSFAARMNTSIHGRELGIQRISSGEMGSTNPAGFLVGTVEGLRRNVANATTAGVMPPYGLSILTTGSSGVHTLGAPIPGVEKYIYTSGGATAYVNTQDATIHTSDGTTRATIKFIGQSLIRLMGVTTAVWATNQATASGVSFAGTT